jgi:nitrate/nitrite transporter NarK
LFLSAPPYIVGAVYTFIIAFCSDKFRKRAVFVSLNSLVTIVGCLLISYCKNKDVRKKFVNVNAVVTVVGSSLVFCSGEILWSLFGDHGWTV